MPHAMYPFASWLMHAFNDTLLPYLCHLPNLLRVPPIPVFQIFLSVSHLPAVIKLHHVL